MTSSSCSPPTIHIVGDAFVDLFSFLEGDWPEPGGDAQLSQPIQTFAGGSSVNTTTHLKALLRNDEDKTQLRLHTILNPNDAYGQILLTHAKEHGFELVNCQQENDKGTGHCICIVAEKERSFMTYRGCVDDFHASHIDAESIINSKGPVQLHLAGFYNLSGFQNGSITERVQYIRQQRKASKHATVVSMVPQHDATKQWDGGIDELIKCLDFLILNDLEALHIMKQGQLRNKMEPKTTAIHAESEELIQECAAYFGDMSPQTCVVLTRGKKGAVALLGGKVVAQQASVEVQPIDPTGAGDSFAAGFLHGLWAWRQSSNIDFSDDAFAWPEEALKGALQWGCAMGTSSVLIKGASIPCPREDIEKFLSDIQKL